MSIRVMYSNKEMLEPIFIKLNWYTKYSQLYEKVKSTGYFKNEYCIV